MLLGLLGERRETLALWSLVLVVILIDLISGAAEPRTYAFLGGLVAFLILAATLFPTYFGLREPRDRGH